MSTIHSIANALACISLLAFATHCGDKSADANASASASAEAAQASTPCGLAGEALSGIAILEVKEVPNEAGAGAKFVKQLAREIDQACVEKGMEKSAGEALTCYGKNKGKAGYRVLKGCDEAPGKELVAAVVDKHGRK
jgi:hypothetical protein